MQKWHSHGMNFDWSNRKKMEICNPCSLFLWLATALMLNYSASNELFAAKLFFFGPFPLRTLLDCMRYCCCILEPLLDWKEMQLHLSSTPFRNRRKSPFWHSRLGLNLNFEYKWGPVEYLMILHFPHHFQKATSFHNFLSPSLLIFSTLMDDVWKGTAKNF